MNPTEYDFTQEIDSPISLIAAINALGLSTPLSYVNTSGSGPTMCVSVVFSDVLSSGDQTTLTALMSAYVNPTALHPIPYMINAINTAIQTPANLQEILLVKVQQTLPTLTAIQLQAIMTLLGLS